MPAGGFAGQATWERSLTWLPVKERLYWDTYFSGFSSTGQMRNELRVHRIGELNVYI